jgi:hypothetical protein
VAAFNNLGLQEPSTITARVATVTVSRGSTTEHQEIMVLGDPESSNGLARILNTVPASTDWGVVVRPVGASTTVNVSSLGGVVAVQQNSTVWQVQVGGYSTTANISSVAGVVTVAPQSSAWQVQVTNQSTIVAVSSVAGNVRVVNSSAADLLVSAVQNGTWNIGTVTAVSSLAGIVAVRPSDTNWASSAGFHFNSSGELLTKDAGNSTIVSIGAGNSSVIITSGNSSVIITSGNSSVTVSAWSAALLSSGVVAGNSSALTVRNVWSSTNADQPVSAAQAGTWNIGTVTTVSSLAGVVAVRPSDTNWASSAGFHFDSSGALQISGTINAASSTNVTISAIFDSSNASVKPGDSANNALRVNVVAGTIVGGSGGTAQADQSAFTTNSGSITPIGGYFSTTASAVPEAKVGVLRMSSVRALWTLPVDSTGGDMTDSTNRGLRVAVVAGGSTTVNVSSVAGVVNVQQNSTVWAAQAVNLDNLGNSIESSTNAVGTNSTRRGLAVRSMLPLSTYASGQAASSGDVTVFTSVAGQSIYVYGVCLHWGGVMTTNTNQLVKLQDGNSTATEYMRWRFQVSAIGATTQPLQAFVSPPAYLFRTAAATNLRLNTASSGCSYSLQAWYE